MQSKNDFYCRECGKPFLSTSAYSIESFLHRILECPRCGSRATRPLEEKDKGTYDPKYSGKSYR